MYVTIVVREPDDKSDEDGYKQSSFISKDVMHKCLFDDRIDKTKEENEKLIGALFKNTRNYHPFNEKMPVRSVSVMYKVDQKPETGHLKPGKYVVTRNQTITIECDKDTFMGEEFED